MFKIINNRFLKEGVIYYMDDYGNKLRMSRNKTGFSAKLRFSRAGVKANVVEVAVPVGDAKGVCFTMTYEDPSNMEEPDVKSAINDVGEIVSRWIDMISDINSLNTPTALLMKAYPGASVEDCSRYKVSFVENYEELVELQEILK